jgi:hypothetical protein
MVTLIIDHKYMGGGRLVVRYHETQEEVDLSTCTSARAVRLVEL